MPAPISYIAQNSLVGELGLEELTVEPCDVGYGDALRAFELAGAGVRAVAESELVHLRDHSLCPFSGLWTALRKESERTYTRSHKEHCRTVFTGRNAGSAAYASGGIHALLSLLVGDEDVVGILSCTCAHGDESSSLKNLVEGPAVNDQVLYHRESGASPRLDGDGSSVLEVPHEELTGGHVVVRTVCTTVDIQRTSSTDTLAAIVVE